MLAVTVLAMRCALAIDVAILQAIVEVESRGNPYALSVNGPMELVRQPRDREDAVRMARWLEEHGYNFDAGLAQVNSANLRWLGLDVASVFEPCANLRAASRVLHECYDRASERFGEGERAVAAALSCYNPGDFTWGLRNGYVAAVRARARGPLAIRSLRERESDAGVCLARPSRERSEPRPTIATSRRPELDPERVLDVFAEAQPEAAGVER